MKIGLSKRGKLAGGFGLLLALLLVIALGVPAGAQIFPTVYHQFIGSVFICDNLVLTGNVTATIAGSVIDWTTPINASGNYGYAPDYFLIPLDDPETPAKDGGEDGDTIQFWVQGRLAGECIFESNEGTILDLHVTDVILETYANPLVGGTVTGAGTYACGDDAPVEANPAGGWEFTGWSGDLTGDVNPTTVDMGGDKSVTANFSETGPDLTPPEVINTSPVNGATGVAVGTLVTATFNESVNPATIVFTLDSVPGNVSYVDPTATFDPTGDLTYSTTYNASIQASDLAGNPMAAPYNWSFTTEGPPGGLTIVLVQGVNIIAYTGVTTNLPDALTNIGPAGLDVVDGLWARGAWTSGAWLYYNARILFGTINQLEAGRAYIIVVTQNCTWELPQ